MTQALRAADGAAAPLLANTSVRALMDEEIAREDSWVYPGQAIGFFPPLSGGWDGSLRSAGDRRSVAGEVARGFSCENSRCRAVVSFCGIARPRDQLG